ncbi:MAG: large repetitive protein, partial [Acidimicrobiaceae bacterium]
MVIALVVVTGGPAAAAVDTESHQATVTLQATGWSTTVAIPKFDPAEGSLQRVVVTLDAHVDGDLAYENLDPLAPADVTGTTAATISLLRSTGDIVLVTAIPSETRTDHLEAYDGLTDFDGASGKTATGLTDDQTATATISAAAVLTRYTGTGSISLPITATNSSSVTGAPNVQSSTPTKASAKVTVVYEYVPDTRPPDPPTITSAPPAFTKDPNVSVAFTTEPGATTECKLIASLGADQPWADCSSPFTVDLAAAADDTYTFSVRATDGALNVGAASTTAFTLDRVRPPPPVLTSVPAPTGSGVHPSWSFTIESGATATCQMDGVDVSCAGSYTGDLALAADGLHTFSVVAIDAALNVSDPAVGTYLLDRSPPIVPTITGWPAATSNDATPTWSFTLPADATGSACAVDGGPFAGCTSPFTADLTSAADGPHSFAVDASDAAGNTGEAAGASYVLDRLKPAPPSISGPTGPSNDRLPVFTISSEAGATFLCRVDAGAFAVCPSSYPADLSLANQGVHTISVQAIDTAGNVGSAAIATYTLDTLAPAPPVFTSGPPTVSNDDQPTWTFNDESGSTPWCAIDGGAFAICASPVTVDLAAGLDGVHTITVKVKDQAGNMGDPNSAGFTLDRSAPGAPKFTAVPDSPSSSSSPTWTFTTPSDGTDRCSLDGGAEFTCSGSYTATLTTDGDHAFLIHARDAAGNTSGTITSTYHLDRVKPAAPTFVTFPPPSGNGTTPAWTFSAEAGALIECSLDGSAWVSCDGSYGADLSAPGLDGLHTLAVRATDAAHNVGDSALATYDLDTTPPGKPSIDTGPAAASSDDQPTWTFTAEAGAATWCRFDDGGWWACPGGTVQADFRLDADGTHSFEVQAIDGVGNTGPAASTAYLLDRQPPPAPTFIETPVSPGNHAAPTWTFTYEQGAVARCRLDSGPWQLCDGTFQPLIGTDGVHLVSVMATDAALNAGEVTNASYTLDTVAPAAPVVSGEPSPGNDPTPTWTITVESGSHAECSMDGRSFAPCGQSFATDLTGKDGPHRLGVR